MNDFIQYNSWFDLKYREFLRGRYYTFKIALNLLPEHPNIVETGSTCRPNDSGSGFSTYIFGDFCSRYNGTLITIDIDPVVIDACKHITQKYAHKITYICQNSLNVLPVLVEPIDLLYLDSMDVPEGDATECQQHNLNEFKAAERFMRDHSVVLIDDNDMENGGKSRLTKEYLTQKGWRCILDLYQTVWIK